MSKVFLPYHRNLTILRVSTILSYSIFHFWLELHFFIEILGFFSLFKDQFQLDSMMPKEVELKKIHSNIPLRLFQFCN